MADKEKTPSWDDWNRAFREPNEIIQLRKWVRKYEDKGGAEFA